MNAVQRDFTPLDRPARDHVLRIAHRGASAYAPENSLEAFHKAAEMQADMVEVDIRITADNCPVVAHDENLQRVYGIPHNIDELTLVELQSQTSARSAHPVPTFEAVTALCAALKLGLYLDIKAFNREAFANVFRSLHTSGLDAFVIFGSFRPDWAAEIKASAPQVRTSILYGSTHINPVLLAQAVRADYVHPCWENAAPEPHTLLTDDWLRTVREAGLGIVTWHEERPSEMDALVRLGVDGVCSDTPDVLAEHTPKEQS